MAERYRAVVMRSNGWKLPFNVALGIHLMVLVGAVYLPAIFKSKPKFADVYSVSLVNVAEPEPAPAAKSPSPGPPKAAAKPPPPAPPPPKIKKEVAPVEPPPKVVEKAKEVEPVQEEEPVVEKPPPPKAVSLKPLQQKKVVKVVKEETPAKKPEKPEIDRKEIQKLAQALKEEEILTEKARLAREAFDQERKLLADSLRASEARQAASSATAERATGSSTAAPSGSSTLLESQYNALILNHLLQFWSVPEYMPKDLTAVVGITIKQDGEVTDFEFESKSGDRMYDQFVYKTIEAAKPFPPIPPALRKQTHEIGLRFKPGDIQ